MEHIAERDDGIRVIRIRDTTEGLPWRAPFAGAYQAIWAEPPYNEDFTPDEAASVLRRALETPDNLTLLAVNEARVVLGFGVSVPVLTRPDVVREIRGLLPIDHTAYFAELGVLEQARHRGLGRQLIELRLEMLDRRRFTHVVLRTSATRNATYDMYRDLGFDDAGVYMEVPSRRVDGRTRTDRRLFMAKVL